jgi:cell division septal protein FtsQ
MNVKAPAEKNFRRSKVKPVKRRGVRRWITWRLVRVGACAALMAYAGYRALDLVLTASSLQVKRVVIRGNVRLSTGEIHALIEGLTGSSILTADLAAYRRRLLDSPWVEDVAIRRLLPSTIELFVSERRPIGLSRLGGQLYLVDRRGTIVDEFGPQYADFDLPIIDGLVRAPGTGESALDDARAELAARVIDALATRSGLAERVSQIDVSDIHDAVVPGRRLGTAAPRGRAVRRAAAVHIDLAPALRQSVREMDYVDLRFGERVRPACRRHQRRRTERGPLWRVRNDIWWGWTSGRRRSRRSSAR